MEEKKNGQGGARKGAGRKPADHPRRRHTIYCNEEELYSIKMMLAQFKRIQAAQKQINLAKGKKVEYDIATDEWLAIESEVNSVTIGQFRKAFKKELFKK